MAKSKRAKAKTRYVCQECGRQSLRWLGRCPACQAWNSMAEEVTSAPRPRATEPGLAVEQARALDEVPLQESHGRRATLIGELDRVLGGGLVPGSAVLLGGDPGIGKSTLALQLAGGLAAAGQTVLYVAGEEAPAQVRARAERLGIKTNGILVLSATDTDSIVAAVKAASPCLAVVDSVQTVYTRRVESAPGTVSQLREASAELITAAREENTATLLIGHVTREGTIAGPRVLEHMVDTVLYFEGDKDHAFRILRAVKNRFGPTGEIGVFEMLADGLGEVSDPSDVFLARRSSAPGSAITASLEGSRPLMVEVQALAVRAGSGSARRTTLGVDHGRVAMLAAVVERTLGLGFADRDLFVNTVGGVRVEEPGADLAVAAALASSHSGRAIGRNTVVIGEVGLTGEVRPVSQLGLRLKEAARLGFKRAVVPSASTRRTKQAESADIETLAVATLKEAWSRLGG